MNFASKENILLLNPRAPVPMRAQIEKAWREHSRGLVGHVGLLTSGTTLQLKIVCLAKQALLEAARGVNEHLEAGPKDVWLKVLPSFHVGGLSIYARAHIARAQIFKFETERWDARQFFEALRISGANLLSLVPTQLHDLVDLGLKAPDWLRATVVGGGALNQALYNRAMELGWKPLPSYGMTETAAMLACAPLESIGASAPPKLKVLSHIRARTEQEIVEVSGPSLFTQYILIGGDGSQVQKPGEWFSTGDVGHLDEVGLAVSGRAADFVKIGGESVSLPRLEDALACARVVTRHPGDVAIVVAPEARLGHTIHLLTTDSDVEALVARYHELVLPFEKIRAVHKVEHIPRTELGKLIASEAQRMLTRSLAVPNVERTHEING